MQRASDVSEANWQYQTNKKISLFYKSVVTAFLDLEFLVKHHSFTQNNVIMCYYFFNGTHQLSKVNMKSTCDKLCTFSPLPTKKKKKLKMTKQNRKRKKEKEKEKETIEMVDDSLW